MDCIKKDSKKPFFSVEIGPEKKLFKTSGPSPRRGCDEERKPREIKP